MGIAIAPQLVGNNGLEALRAAIAAPERYAIEPKVDGVRGMLAFEGDNITIRNRKGMVRERWLACQPFQRGLSTFADSLPLVRNGTVLDGELTAGSFHRTMAVLRGSWPWETSLRLVVFDLPVFAGVDLRFEPLGGPPAAARVARAGFFLPAHPFPRRGAVSEPHRCDRGWLFGRHRPERPDRRVPLRFAARLVEG